MTTRRERIEQVNVENSVKTQLYRWFACFERTPRDIALAQEIVAPDVLLRNGERPESRGHEGLRRQIEAFPAELRVSHQLQALTARAGDDGKIHVTADAVLQTVTPAQGLSSRSVRYDAKLQAGSDLLPRFTEIVSTPGPELELPTLVDTYALNRSLAALFAWLAPLEATQHGPDSLRDVVADEGIEFHLGGGEPITTWDGIRHWFTTRAVQSARSGHALRQPRVAEIARGRYRLSAQFDWEGIDLEGRGMAAKTQHDWELVDTGERFARIQKLRAKAIEPFRVVPD